MKLFFYECERDRIWLISQEVGKKKSEVIKESQHCLGEKERVIVPSKFKDERVMTNFWTNLCRNEVLEILLR
jgi:hypothetical protein